MAYRFPDVHLTWAAVVAMAEFDLKLVAKVAVAIMSILASIFFFKLYEARSLVRNLQKQGYVREKTIKLATRYLELTHTQADASSPLVVWPCRSQRECPWESTSVCRWRLRW